MRRNPDPDDAVVGRARSGEPAAFEELVRKYQAGVYGYLFRMCHNAADAEDLAQETFIRAWQALPRFRQESSFKTWLYRIATNLCLNRLSRTRRTEPLDETIPARTADEPQEAWQRKRRTLAVESALAALPPDQRSAVILSVYEDLSYAEICAAMGKSIPSVTSLLYRARNALRQSLQTAREKGLL